MTSQPDDEVADDEKERTGMTADPGSTLVMNKGDVEPNKEGDAATTAVTSTASPDGSPPTKTAKRQRTGRAQRFIRMGAGVWVGLAVIAAGFGLIAFTWSKVAALLTVSLQLPYVISGGFVGLGLILFGLLITNLAIKRREALERSRQLDEIREALVRLRSAVEGSEE